ncbi:glycosyltransferase family 4 protein [Silvibacterium acidisoli]|uniref:glycosyltransferase family 4 protein n=1 Tax=Acidobacteriaceae bacterium ZG23-2 TaxID=2883246 RepID=UPI00406CF778
MRILRYAKSLRERGDTVDVIALRRSGAPAFEVIDGVNVYRVQGRERNERGALKYAARIMRFMAVSFFALTARYFDKAYDVIHVHSVPDVLVFAAIVPKIFGARVILDIHDILPEFFASKFGVPKQSLKYRAMLLAERASAWFSDHVIIANDLWQPRLVNRSVEKDQCTTIINYPDDELFFPRDVVTDPNKFRITYPGTLNAHQGVDVAVHAMALLKAEMPELEFHIYGEGPSKPSLMVLSESLGLGGVVIFHDFLPCDQIADIMALSDVAVVPKKASSDFGNEAMSTKIMEFMAIGVPVIASRTRVDTFYHDASRVRFFTSEDPRDLAVAIRQLRHDPELRKLLAQNALAYMRSNGWAQKQKIYLQLIDNLSSPAGLVSKEAGVTS